MKKRTWFLSVLMVFISIAVFAGGSGETVSADGTWKPTKNVEWVVTSSPGGGSDIFTRTITDIIARNKLVDQTIVINNQTDGGGEVGRLRVSLL